MSARVFMLVAYLAAVSGCNDKPQVVTTPGAPESRAVEILRDSWGIPHIYGRDHADVLFGLGYAMAEDQILTMGSFRLEAQGRLSQLYADDEPSTAGVDGRAALLASDLFHRLFDVAGAVERRWAGLDADEDAAWGFHSRALAEAFAAGINRYIDERQGSLPAWIEPWSGQDVLAIGRQQAVFNDFEALAGKSRALAGQVVLAGLAPLSRGPADGEYAPQSNQFALAPSRTDNGSMRLLASPHMPFSGHALWYLSHLVSDGFEGVGGGLIGVPAHSMAFSPYVAFSLTNNGTDNVDFYRLTLDATDPTRYLRDGAPVPFEVVDQAVTLADGTPHTFALVYASIGAFRCPIVTPSGSADFSGRQEVIAACTTLQDDVGILAQLWRMQRARSLGELKEALAMRSMNKWNIVAGDRDGHIFYICNSRHPRRAGHSATPVLLDGSSSADDWSGLFDVAELPQATDPSAGFVQNCNNSPSVITDVDDVPISMAAYPPGLCPYGNGPRSRLMRERLAASTQHTFAELDALVRSNYVLVAAEWVPLLLQAHQAYGSAPEIQSPQAVAAVIAVLAAWSNFEASIDNRALALFGDWLVRLRLPLTAPSSFTRQEAIAGLNALATSAAAIEAAFGRIDPRWGDIHRIRRGAVDLEISGTDKELQALHLTATESYSGGVGYAVRGSSLHLLGELRPDGYRVVGYKPWGQSEDPASPHYADLTVPYAENRHVELWLGRDAIEANLERRLELSPP